MGGVLDLSEDARIRLVREGGLVAAPGLARPREIVLVDCSDDQREHLRRVLDDCRRYAVESAGAADQRFFRIVISRDKPTQAQLAELIVEEAQAPTALIALWRDGLRA